MNIQIDCPVCKLNFEHEYYGEPTLVKLRCQRCKSFLEYNRLADHSEALNCVDAKYIKRQLLLKGLIALIVLVSAIVFAVLYMQRNSQGVSATQMDSNERHEEPQKEPTLFEIWSYYSYHVKGMNFDERINLAKNPPVLPEITESPQALLDIYDKKEITRKAMLNGVTSLQANMLSQSFSPKWDWPKPNNLVKINVVAGTVKEIRRKGIVESFFEMWDYEPVDWYVIIMETNRRKFIVYVPPDLANDLARIQLESWFDFGSCLSVSASRYVPEKYWDAFWTPPNER